MSNHLEREIKLLAASDSALETALTACAGQHTLTDHSYVDRYLDCADHTLLHHGLALRLREQNTTGRWMELKGFGTASRGMTHRPEWRQTAPAGRISRCQDLTDGPVRRHVLTLIPPDATLSLLFTCRIERRTTTMTLPTGTVMEIAFDKGDVRAGQHQARIHEVEVEWLAGPGESVLTFAHDLAARHGLILADHSKFARGLALLGWKIARRE